jgi:Ig domain of plant-specific actin-binding protein
MHLTFLLHWAGRPRETPNAQEDETMRKSTLFAALAAAAATALLMTIGIGAAGQAVPSNTSLPSISGSARDGSILTASHGSWTGNPSSYAYQWERCDAQGGNCTGISGATSKQYTVQTADVGNRLRVQVTATNGSGSGVATSRPTSVVAATGQAPKNTAAPTISGTTKEGSTLTVNHGTWTGTQPITFTYQWQRCDATGGNCTSIAGATGGTYVLTSADVGNTIRANVTAKNSRGSALATTAETDLIAPATGGGGHAISVAQVSLPNRLVVDKVSFAPSPLRSHDPLVARFHVEDTRGFSIQGALVYALGLPYNYAFAAPETPTDSSGWATIQIRPRPELPLRNGGALVIFVRARKPGDNLLAGVSTRRLVQARISAP